jgi:hypothetical protein
MWYFMSGFLSWSFISNWIMLTIVEGGLRSLAQMWAKVSTDIFFMDMIWSTLSFLCAAKVVGYICGQFCWIQIWGMACCNNVNCKWFKYDDLKSIVCICTLWFVSSMVFLFLNHVIWFENLLACFMQSLVNSNTLSFSSDYYLGLW